MKKNDLIEIYIEDTTLLGSGVGHVDGMVVFVTGAVEGDTVIAHILKVKKQMAFAKIESIVTPSKDRINVDCPSFPSCGGCNFRHISYEKELEIKYNQVKSNFQKFYGKDVKLREIVSNKNINNYRNKAQIPLDNRKGEIVAGFYSNHSHRVVNFTNCNLQPVEFDNITKVIKDFIKTKDLSIYSEENGEGLIRHIYLRKAFVTGEIMVVIVIKGKELPFSEDLVNRLVNKFGESIKSVQLNINEKDTNVILGERCKVLYGSKYIFDVLCGVRVRISPLSFYQVNHDMAELLYCKAKEYANPSGKTVIDLYCGAGTIGLSMADAAKEIIGVEIIEQAVVDAIENAKDNNFSNCRFICNDAAVAAKTLSEEKIKPDVVIVDPPRKGCSPDLIDTICNKFSPERVVYVSCDSATLARDCKIFEDYGYKVVEVTPFDLFPRTSHIECASYLTKI